MKISTEFPYPKLIKNIASNRIVAVGNGFKISISDTSFLLTSDGITSDQGIYVFSDNLKLLKRMLMSYQVVHDLEKETDECIFLTVKSPDFEKNIDALVMWSRALLQSQK